LKAGKPDDYLDKVEDYWKNAREGHDGRRDHTERNRQVITPTQAVINHCAENELCPPIRIKQLQVRDQDQEPVTLEWLNIFCTYARPVIKALVLDMFSTACRFAEARRREWKDFDFNNRTILIRDTKTKQERIAHMPQPLLVALANLPRDEKPFHCRKARCAGSGMRTLHAPRKPCPDSSALLPAWLRNEDAARRRRRQDSVHARRLGRHRAVHEDIRARDAGSHNHGGPFWHASDTRR